MQSCAPQTRARVAIVDTNDNTYEHQFEQPFAGTRIPCGCLVEYKPESEREVKKLQKFGSKLRPGIFMGHHAHNGGAWSGDYYVVDSEAFTTCSPDTQRAYVHRVKEILHDGTSLSRSKMVHSCRPIP